MSQHPITDAVATLLAADPAACDRAGLAELVAVAQWVRGWLDAFDATVATHADRLAAAGSAEPATDLLTDGGRRSVRDARTATDRGAVCAAMPQVHDALATGVVSAGHVDAIARASRELDDRTRDALAAHAPGLIDAASTTPVEAFARHVRDLTRQLSADDGVRQHERLRQQRSLRRWTDHQTGLAHTHLALDPESDARLSAALDAAVTTERAAATHDDARTFDQLRADAFVSLATGARTNSGRRPAELSVLIDLATLQHGLHDHAVCETADGLSLPPATVRRIACDAAIIPLVLDGHGAVLDAGRARRVATADQRHALRAMYRTCGHPHCTIRFADCQIHHVTEWIRQRGPTNLANLLPLCDRHHHLVHEGGWHLTLHPDRTITLRRPDGTLAHTGTTIDVAPAGAQRDMNDHDHLDNTPTEPVEVNEIETQTDDEIAVMTALTRARLRTLRPPPTRAA